MQSNIETYLGVTKVRALRTSDRRHGGGGLGAGLREVIGPIEVALEDLAGGLKSA
jgi:hypothetical protein